MSAKLVSVCVSSFLAASVALACPGSNNPNAKCGEKPIEKIIGNIGKCVSPDLIEKNDKNEKQKPGWYKNPKLIVELQLAYDSDGGNYFVETLINNGKGKPIAKAALFAQDSNDVVAEVTLLGKAGAFKLALERQYKPSTYSAYFKFTLPNSKPEYVELKCDLDPNLLAKLAKEGK